MTPENRLMKWGEEKELNLRQKMLQAEAQKQHEPKQPNSNKNHSKEQQLAHAERLIKIGEKKKKEIKALVDERMADLFKPKINQRSDLGGSQTERIQKRQNGEWYGYVSGKNTQTKNLEDGSLNKSDRLARKAEDGHRDVSLQRRHEMSTKYESELQNKRGNTLFGRDYNTQTK